MKQKNSLASDPIIVKVLPTSHLVPRNDKWLLQKAVVTLLRFLPSPTPPAETGTSDQLPTPGPLAPPNPGSENIKTYHSYLDPVLQFGT